MMLPTPILLPHMHLFRVLWRTHCTKTRDSWDNATSLPRWKHRVQTRASLSDQGPAQPRAAREQRTPFTGCTTSVLTNRPITCELNCCKRPSFLKHLLRPQIFSIRLFLWGSQPTQMMFVSLRSPQNRFTNGQEWWRTMLPWTLRWMRWHKKQRSKNILSSLQVNVPDRKWLPLTARVCFLARQDRWLDTLVLTSTLWAAFDVNSNEGTRRPSEPGPDFAQFGFGQASHCGFGAFFSRRCWFQFCIRVWNPFACDPRTTNIWTVLSWVLGGRW